MNRHGLAERWLSLAQRFPVVALLVRPWVLIAWGVLLLAAWAVPLVSPYAAERLTQNFTEFIWYELVLLAAPLIPLAAWYQGLRGVRMKTAAVVRAILLVAVLAILSTSSVLGVAMARWSTRGDSAANDVLCAEGLVWGEYSQRLASEVTEARAQGLAEETIEASLLHTRLLNRGLFTPRRLFEYGLLPVSLRCSDRPTGTAVSVHPSEVYWMTPEVYADLQELGVRRQLYGTIDRPVPLVLTDSRGSLQDIFLAQSQLLLRARAANGDEQRYLLWHAQACLLLAIAPLMALIALSLLTSPTDEFHESQAQRSPEQARWLMAALAIPVLLPIVAPIAFLRWRRARSAQERRQRWIFFAASTALMVASSVVLLPELLLGLYNKIDVTGALTLSLLAAVTLIGSWFALRTARFQMAQVMLFITVCCLAVLPAWAILAYEMPPTVDKAFAVACAACAFLCAILAHYVRTASSPFAHGRGSQP